MYVWALSLNPDGSLRYIAHTQRPLVGCLVKEQAEISKVGTEYYKIANVVNIAPTAVFSLVYPGVVPHPSVSYIL